MNVLDLFSGIGGFSLGLERAGFKTVAFCEIDPYCRRVLARHWPDVPVYDDVRTLTAARLVGDTAKLQRNGGKHHAGSNSKGADTFSQSGNASGIDVICGGFPCQDISTAGKGAGITGERSGLWKEYARIIGEVRPRYAIIENVAALLHRGLSDVLFDLSALGYDAEWHCIPASAVGAPHRRDRIWIVAYPNQQRCMVERVGSERHFGPSQSGAWYSSQAVADAAGQRLEGTKLFGSRYDLGAFVGDNGWWLTEPDVGRVAHGVPARVDRLRSLGNAVVPQIPEIIGRAIMKAQP